MRSQSVHLRGVALLRDKIPSYDLYPFFIPAIRSLQAIELKRPVTFFVGENGTGKSTLLEAIAHQCGFNPAGGSRDNVYALDASASALGDYIRLSWRPKVTSGFFFRAETFYHFASYLDKVDSSGYKHYGGKSLHHQSHGEAFMSLFLHRFKGKTLYLLDEPESALSPSRQLAFLRVLRELTDRQAQFIIATHSPILLGYPDATIYSFDEEIIMEIEYDMTEHVQITKYFLLNREKILEELWKDERK